MNLRVAFSIRRQSAIEAFTLLRMQAQLRQWAAALLGGSVALDDFADIQPLLKPNRNYAGLQDVPVSQITGSVGRAKDFDRNFRPLKKHLFGRWVSNYLNMQGGSWPRIRVYKVGSQYFVVDGHHRVSVARSTGVACLPAEVWEYALAKAPAAAVAPARSFNARAAHVQEPCSC